MAEVRREALDIVAGRVRDANTLIEALGRLRRTLDRYDWLGPGWHSGRSVGVRTAGLKLSLVIELEAVSSAARKLGGRSVVRLADDLDAARVSILAPIDPPDDAGMPAPERERVRQILDALLDTATRAAQRKRRVQAVVVAAFVIGAALGFVLGLLVGSGR